jgi:hypothetical protein
MSCCDNPLRMNQGTTTELDPSLCPKHYLPRPCSFWSLSTTNDSYIWFHTAVTYIKHFKFSLRRFQFGETMIDRCLHIDTRSRFRLFFKWKRFWFLYQSIKCFFISKTLKAQLNIQTSLANISQHCCTTLLFHFVRAKCMTDDKLFSLLIMTNMLVKHRPTRGAVHATIAGTNNVRTFSWACIV